MTTEPIPVIRVNHVVLRVRSLERSVAFYTQLFALSEDVERYGKTMGFLRARGSLNHHDLGFVEVGEQAPIPPEEGVGLFHFALEVPTIADLLAVRGRLIEQGLLVREHDHGATRSLYGRDPDGHNFEVMWMAPRESWGQWEHAADRMPLDLEAEICREDNPVSAEPGTSTSA